MNILFFGSTTDSVLVLDALYHLPPEADKLNISAVVTQPPRPIGRKQIVTPTPVEKWAREKQIAVLSFPSDPAKPWLYENEQAVVDTLSPFGAELLVSASYGQKIPTPSISRAKYGGLNVHPSLLPRWRGADPVPWAIMTGDRQTGVTVVTISEEFDQGKIIAQKKVAITDTDFADPLRTKLFAMGANLLRETLADYLSGKTKGRVQHKTDTPYSKRLSRSDGFESWEGIQIAFETSDEAIRIERKFRALTPWPGIWSEVQATSNKKQEKKRMKILACHLSPASCLVLDSVQLEGKQPVTFKQFTSSYLQETP